MVKVREFEQKVLRRIIHIKYKMQDKKKKKDRNKIEYSTNI